MTRSIEERIARLSPGLRKQLEASAAAYGLTLAEYVYRLSPTPIVDDDARNEAKRGTP